MWCKLKIYLKLKSWSVSGIWHQFLMIFRMQISIHLLWRNWRWGCMWRVLEHWESPWEMHLKVDSIWIMFRWYWQSRWTGKLVWKKYQLHACTCSPELKRGGCRHWVTHQHYPVHKVDMYTLYVCTCTNIYLCYPCYYII